MNPLIKVARAKPVRVEKRPDGTLALIFEMPSGERFTRIVLTERSKARVNEGPQ